MSGILAILQAQDEAKAAAAGIRECLQAVGAPADEATVLSFLRALDVRNMSIRRGKGGRPKGSKNHAE